MHVSRILWPLAFSLVACCGDDAVGPIDASTDASDSAHDAYTPERDGGRDAARDASRDAADRDTGMDVEGWWDEAGWVPMPGIPEPCVIERATNPSVLYQAEWTSCGDGCERLVADSRLVRAFDETSGWHDGMRGYFFVVQRASDDSLGRRMVVLATTEGTALAAWRGPAAFGDDGVCQVGATSVGDGSAAFSIRRYMDGSGEFMAYHAPLSEIALATVPIGSYPGADGQEMVNSASTVAVERQPTGIAHVFEEGRDGTVGRTSEVPGSVHGLSVVGQDLYYNEYGSRWRAAYASLDRSAAIFREKADADVIMFATDGAACAWIEAYDRLPGSTWARAELWTAPYTDDAGALAPRYVRLLPGVIEFTIGDGYIGYRITIDGPQRIELHNLADGSRKTFVAPDGWVLPANPNYIANGEMLVRGRGAPGPTVFRVQLASLPVMP